MNFEKCRGEKRAGESSHVYGRDLRFRWFGIYHGILSEIAFHEKAGRTQVVFCFFVDKVFLPAEPPLSPPFHPHLSMSDCFRSVQVGCSRFSRCCHRIVDLSFHPAEGSWARPLTQSPELGAWALYFLAINPNYAAAGSTIGLL